MFDLTFFGMPSVLCAFEALILFLVAVAVVLNPWNGLTSD